MYTSAAPKDWARSGQSIILGEHMGKFLNDTALVSLGDNRWQAELHKGWRIGKVPNGGYVMGVIGRAISQTLNDADPLSINAFYLEPTMLGHAEIDVEILREGKGTQFAAARLYQEGGLKLVANAAFTDLDRLKGPTNTLLEPPQVPRFNPTQAQPHGGLEIHDTVDIRVVKGQEFFERREPTNTGEFIAYMRYSDGAEIGTLDLLMFVDMMPPPAFTLVPNVGWVPTVELTVQVRGKPAPGPILCRARSTTLMSGVTELDCEIWDANGALVALGRQTMKVRAMS